MVPTPIVMASRGTFCSPKKSLAASFLVISSNVISRVRVAMEAVQNQLPSGLQARIAYDATNYIRNAIREVIKTLSETLLIVVVIIFLFLGSLRSAIIPVIAIPLSLIGGDRPIRRAGGG